MLVQKEKRIMSIELLSDVKLRTKVGELEKAGKGELSARRKGNVALPMVNVFQKDTMEMFLRGEGSNETVREFENSSFVFGGFVPVL